MNTPECPFGREDCSLADTGTSYWCATCLLVGSRDSREQEDDEQHDDS